ncbi:hypothetical protein SNEBB_002790 [Seison nebaliae]|nr:hypothetical protein SNEBB_002790 [Seison nebaliae]
MAHNKATIAFVNRVLPTFRKNPNSFGHVISKVLFNYAEYNRYGLLWHDVINDTEPNIKEAVTRLPPELRDERHYRINRALVLNVQKKFLPKEEWTTWEKDYPYLTPFLEDIEKEMTEKERWEKI